VAVFGLEALGLVAIAGPTPELAQLGSHLGGDRLSAHRVPIMSEELIRVSRANA
jgi:hypothetical protein